MRRDESPKLQDIIGSSCVCVDWHTVRLSGGLPAGWSDDNLSVSVIAVGCCSVAIEHVLWPGKHDYVSCSTKFRREVQGEKSPRGAWRREAPQAPYSKSTLNMSVLPASSD